MSGGGPQSDPTCLSGIPEARPSTAHGPATPAKSPTPWYLRLDPHKLYSVPELAIATGLKTCLIRDLFSNVDGVLEVSRRRKGKRIYRTRFIPGALAIFIFSKMTIGGEHQ